MTCCIHHVPGRLRVKSPALKNSGGRAEAAKELLRAVDGVTRADANARTGSVTVYYDHGRVKPAYLLSLFVANEWINLCGPLRIAGVVKGKAARSGPPLIDAFAAAATKTVVQAVLGKLLPRAAVVVLRALA